MLVTGLCLGSILPALLANPSVTSVVVIEQDERVRELVLATVNSISAAMRLPGEGAIRVARGDALTVEPRQFGVFDSAWHDIWPTITAMNLKDMILLLERWPVRGVSMCWSLANALAQIGEVSEETRSLCGRVIQSAGAVGREVARRMDAKVGSGA